ncbi:uncharacterized protein MONOS_6268 [Monocercomonoides exilis]|uniref:uncharacterized protein n=1 Tax=Monocercomonoides exilis TaxID=2049356 RepID=UPI003559565F|nr:hypothetical protein MONOS_6268 [Monocercomonoides exilis]|eukprot:MONOS_6268.1-p1 / transcript=MONOS_6268.1 / gene=MONOS_6268 / organism=Monocercomonoides_exilis_PA203 / gene_product=unspecified product / transcript_product=unspecified product / location=Mono_scaffold00195:38033-38896(-) / protein_length=118 / sequence_SO=supercontig / SO=protein_coding / is_pseudo=false
MAQQNDCELTGALSWISQTLLFLVAFVAVFFMRQKESPKRPLKVWWFDLLKQTVGTIIQHFSSLGLSLLFSGNANEDPCVCSLVFVVQDTLLKKESDRLKMERETVNLKEMQEEGNA